MFESRFFRNPEDRFYHVEAHMLVFIENKIKRQFIKRQRKHTEIRPYHSVGGKYSGRAKISAN